MSPYNKKLKSITDIAPFFKKEEATSQMIFVGETLEIRIPQRFTKYGALTIEDSVTTLGVMDLIIDNEYQAMLNILASITIHPSEIDTMTYDGLDYLVLKLKKGDVFIDGYRVVKDGHVVYVLWTEFVTQGNPIYTLDYDKFLRIFENVRELTGSGIGVTRSVFEGIVSHICRDTDNVITPYRLTEMVKPMQTIALNSISTATSSTLARLNGSYFTGEGLTSALQHEVTEHQPFENLLRGLPATFQE